MKYAFIESQRGIHTIQQLCTSLDVAPSGYYAWRKHPIGKQQLADEKMAKLIKPVFDASGQTYGYLRVWKECQKQNIPCGKHRVARLMKTNGWFAKAKKRVKSTTKSNPEHPKTPNRLRQNFKATKMNEKWTTDITYIPTSEGWLYLAVVLDLYSRRVVGWSMDDNMEAALVVNALRMAVAQRSPSAELLHHSDQGSQYTSQSYRDELTRWEMVSSMSRRGNCYDNAVTESFFGTLKMERVDRQIYATRQQAKQDIFAYIEGFYNTRRLHSTLGYLSPAEFESQYKQTRNNLSSVCLH